MAKLLRIIGIVNIIAGLILSIVFQTLKVSSAAIAAAEYRRELPPIGLDSFTADIVSVSTLVGAAIGCLMFFAVARILDRVEDIHRAITKA